MDSLVYFLSRFADGEAEIWSTDGTSANTQKVPNLQFPPELYGFSYLNAGGDHLYLRAYHEDFGQTLIRVQPATGAMKIETMEAPFAIFPNPVQDQLTLRLPEDIRALQEVRLLNIQGQEIVKYPLSSLQGYDLVLDIPPSIGPGYYFLLVRTEDSQQLLKVQVK
jgi:hypothetical protein